MRVRIIQKALLHNITGLGGFLTGLAGKVVLARVFRRTPEWRSHYRFTEAMLAYTVVMLVVQAVLPDSISGLTQRLFIASLLVWIEVTAIVLYRRLSTE